MTSEFHIPLFVVGSIWFYRSIRACLAMQRVPFLAPLDATAMRPWVTVVLVARNAARGIANCVRDVLAQDAVEVEAVVVVDRADSEAVTAALAGAVGDTRIRIERVGEVPDGWLPRPHAIATGVAAARGEWIVLLDQPARLARDALARTLRVARDTRAGLVALIPAFRTSPFLTPLAISSLIDGFPSIAATNRDRPAMPWSTSFTAVRADALRAAGGHAALRMTPMNELALAERVREAGHRLRVVQAPDEVRFELPIRTPAILEMLERVIAATGFHLIMLSLALAVYGVVWAMAVWGLGTDNAWGLFAFGGLASQAVPGVLIARTYGLGVLAGLAVPLALPLELGLAAYALVRIRVRRGVRWQGRFFSIESIKAAAREDD